MSMTAEQSSKSPAIAATPVPPRYWWAKRIGIVSGISIISLAVLRPWWGHYAVSAIQIEVDRIISTGEPIYPEDFDSVYVPAESNAVSFYKNAIGQLQLGIDTHAIVLRSASSRRQDSNALEISDDRVEGIGRGYSIVLYWVRRARTHSEIDWGTRIRSPALDWRVDGIEEQQLLSDFLVSAVELQLICGEFQDAIVCVRDVLAFGEATAHLPGISAHARHVAINGAASDSAVRVLNDLARTEAKALAEDRGIRRELRWLLEELLEEGPSRDGLRRAVFAQRMTEYDTYSLMINGGRSAWWTGVPKAGFGHAAFRFLRPVVDLDMARTMRCLQGYLDNVAAGRWSSIERSCIMPYPPWGATVGGCIRGRAARLLRRSLERPRDYSVRLDWLFDYHYQGIAKRRMAAIAIAAFLYSSDNGGPPEYLSELVDQYLPRELADPFATGRPIQYSVKGRELHLRSAGDNKEDANRFLIPNAGITGGWNGFNLRYMLLLPGSTMSGTESRATE